MKRTIRFPLFAKFFVGCLLLAGLLIIGGTYVIKDETRLRSRGNFLATASEDKSELVAAVCDLDQIEETRKVWQFYRDRRPEAYGDLVKP